MKFPRRRFLSLAAGVAAFLATSRIASAQAYPTRPVRLICGFGGGSATDIVARLIGEALSERLGQPFVIENRPAAASNLATEYVVRAAPDGYTLLQITPPNAINATLYTNLSYNFIRDIAPVASIGQNPLVMVVNPSFPATTVAAFIAYAKANPGKINFASAGTGTGLHVAGELFKMMTGIDMIHAPYRGDAPAITDLIAGQVQVIFDPIVACIGQIKAGKLRALAVTTATRSAALPDVLTVASVPGYEARGWQELALPETRLLKSSTRSTRRSMHRSPIRRCSNASPTSAIRRSPFRLPVRRPHRRRNREWGKAVKFPAQKRINPMRYVLPSSAVGCALEPFGSNQSLGSNPLNAIFSRLVPSQGK